MNFFELGFMSGIFEKVALSDRLKNWALNERTKRLSEASEHAIEDIKQRTKKPLLHPVQSISNLLKGKGFSPYTSGEREAFKSSLETSDSLLRDATQKLKKYRKRVPYDIGKYI